MNRQRQFPATITREGIEYRRDDTPHSRNRKDGTRKAIYRAEVHDEGENAPSRQTLIVNEKNLRRYVSENGPAESGSRTSLFRGFEIPRFFTSNKRQAS